MNCKSLRILTIVLMLMGITFTSGLKSAHALPVSEADAWIDWSTLSVEWNGAEADWLNPTEFSSESYVTGSIAWSDAWRDLSSDNFGVEASIISNQACASAAAWQYGTFTANIDGTLNVSVEYYIDQNLNTDAGTAQASSEAWLWLARTDIDDTYYSEDKSTMFNDNTGDYGESGTLSVSLFFGQGHTGEFSVGVWNETNAANPVPEPATIILLGCGLVGIAGFGKKRLTTYQD